MPLSPSMPSFVWLRLMSASIVFTFTFPRFGICELEPKATAPLVFCVICSNGKPNPTVPACEPEPEAKICENGEQGCFSLLRNKIFLEKGCESDVNSKVTATQSLSNRDKDPGCRKTGEGNEEKCICEREIPACNTGSVDDVKERTNIQAEFFAKARKNANFECSQCGGMHGDPCDEDPAPSKCDFGSDSCVTDAVDGIIERKYCMQVDNEINHHPHLHPDILGCEQWENLEKNHEKCICQASGCNKGDLETVKKAAEAEVTITEGTASEDTTETEA